MCYLAIIFPENFMEMKQIRPREGTCLSGTLLNPPMLSLVTTKKPSEQHALPIDFLLML